MTSAMIRAEHPEAVNLPPLLSLPTMAPPTFRHKLADMS